MPAPGIASHIGREVEITALDKTWRLSRLTRGLWREWFAWAKTVLPDPLKNAHEHVKNLVMEETALRQLQTALAKPEAARSIEESQLIIAKGMPLDQVNLLLQTISDEQKHHTTVAIDKAASMMSFGSPEINSLLAHPDGMSRLLWLALKKHQPDVTEDDAFEILLQVGNDKMKEIFETLSGVNPTPEKK
jgi:hypothetical protein